MRQGREPQEAGTALNLSPSGFSLGMVGTNGLSIILQRLKFVSTS